MLPHHASSLSSFFQVTVQTSHYMFLSHIPGVKGAHGETVIGIYVYFLHTETDDECNAQCVRWQMSKAGQVYFYTKDVRLVIGGSQAMRENGPKTLSSKTTRNVRKQTLQLVSIQILKLKLCLKTTVRTCKHCSRFSFILNTHSKKIIHSFMKVIIKHTFSQNNQ